LIGSIGPGETFTDATNNLTISHNANDASGITFTVSVGLLAPTNLKAVAGSTQIALSWTASAGATSYNVKRASTSGGPYSPIAIGISGTSFLDTGLTDGQTYYYVVAAVSGSSVSGDSAPASATPNGIDLIVSALGNPPASAAAGASFTVSSTVKNNGAIGADASTARFYLSTNATKDAGDALFAATRAVAALGAGATSSGNTTLTIPAGTPAGAYYLLACADDLGAVAETDETNNCRASATTLQITLPDLAITALGIPSTAVAAGGAFKITDTLKNLGTVASPASTVRYYLSDDQTKGGADIVLGSRSVASLNAGASSNGSLNVTVPASTPVGAYYVLSCADDTGAVAESNEANNCRASTTQLLVALPDLIVSAVGNPPSSISRGGKFRASDTTRNQGTVAATASMTRYYLSVGTQKGSGDILAGTRSISSLNAGSNSNGTPNVTVPSSTPVGTYYLLVCADDASAVTESDEANNCRASAGTVVVK
jgi:subtilase family serine protease